MDASDATLELANARVLVGARQPIARAGEAHGDARSADPVREGLLAWSTA